MKKEKRYEVFWVSVAVILLLLAIAMISLAWFTDSEIILQGINKTRMPNTIELYVYEEPHNPDNLDKKHFADVYVVNGSLDVFILEREDDIYIRMLRAAFDSIEKSETLPLTVEPELGLIQAVEIPRNSSDYIYAVAEYLRNSFETKIVYSEYEQVGRISEFECIDMYDKIDTDLQNANYCENDSDCRTLPLAGPYIEFGCYHYVNKKENSTDFYRRMNEYLADCERVIDLCSMSPEPICKNEKCIEK